MRRENGVGVFRVMYRLASLSSRLLALVVFFLCSLPAPGQEHSFDFEITPFGAYRVGGEFEEQNGTASIDVDDSESFGLIFNARHSPVTQWEIIYSRQETSADAAGFGLSDPAPDLTVEYLQAGGSYLWDGEKVRPYLAATIGGTRVDISTPGFDSDTFWSLALGLGLQVSPSSRLGIRLEARGYATFLDTDSDLFCQFSPTNNICALRIEGTIMWQTEAIAGIVFRF